MDDQKKIAYQFIVLLGIVSLFGDITYEAARSITGPYLAVLGAGASVVGFVAGLGEFLGYALRLGSGYLSDRTEHYWIFTIAGYGMLIAVPLLAFSGRWETAALLIIMERMGKAVRTPARDAILSHSTKQVGRGWGFAIHEALDQVGAIIGPLIFSAVFFLKGGYRTGYSILWAPAILSITFVLAARARVPSPEKLESSMREEAPSVKGAKRLPAAFWLYALFIFLSVTGFANFQLISYHFKTNSIVPDTRIPLFYAIAMGVDALTALLIGRSYDRIGLRVLIAVPFLTLFVPFFAFSNRSSLALWGMIIWGIVMGIHETVMRAAIADLTPVNRRGVAYGLFNTVYGVSLLMGSALMGVLLEISTGHLILFVIMMELISIILFFFFRKRLYVA